jgi:hypothetical protein
MTVVRSASGTRIDCDECPEYTAAPSLSLDILRRATGFVSDGSRDFCPSCYRQQPTLRLATSSAEPPTPGG